MQDLIPYPNINAKDAETQAKQINNYLLQLKEAVEFEFMRISSESHSALNTLTKSIIDSDATREEQMSQVGGKVTDVSKGVMSAISQTADNIMLEVNKKVGAEEVVSSINVSKDAIELKSNRISIDSDNFDLTKDGKVVAKSLTITGGSIDISSITEYSNPIILKDKYGRIIEIGPYSIEFRDATTFAEIGAGFVSVGTYSGDTFYPKANIYSSGTASFQGVYEATTTDAPNVNMMSNGYMKRSTSSSQRYKTDITEELSDALDPQKLYSLPVKSFKYKDDYLSENDKRYRKDVIGFIVEDLAEVYECAVQYNEEGQPEMWNSLVMIPALLKLIQEQNERIKALEERL